MIAATRVSKSALSASSVVTKPAMDITMAVSAFVVTVAYRSFQLNGHDEVSDDIEDRRIRELAERDDVSDSFEDISFSDTGETRVSE